MLTACGIGYVRRRASGQQELDAVGLRAIWNEFGATPSGRVAPSDCSDGAARRCSSGRPSTTSVPTSTGMSSHARNRLGDSPHCKATTRSHHVCIEPTRTSSAKWHCNTWSNVQLQHAALATPALNAECRSPTVVRRWEACPASTAETRRRLRGRRHGDETSYRKSTRRAADEGFEHALTAPWTHRLRPPILDGPEAFIGPYRSASIGAGRSRMIFQT